MRVWAYLKASVPQSDPSNLDGHRAQKTVQSHKIECILVLYLHEIRETWGNVEAVEVLYKNKRNYKKLY